METHEPLDCRNPSRSADFGWARSVIQFKGRLLRRLAFGLLRLFEPVVLPFLFWLAVGGVALWVIFVCIAHDPGFPTLRVLLMSLGCLLGFVVYCGMLELLRPVRH
jgi:hypothetical protein